MTAYAGVGLGAVEAGLSPGLGLRAVYRRALAGLVQPRFALPTIRGSSVHLSAGMAPKVRVALTHRSAHQPTAQSNEQIYLFFEHFLKPPVQTHW